MAAQRARRLGFLVWTAAFPLLLLGGLEGGLRALGVGGRPLFVAPPDAPHRRHANPEVMRRYFGSSGSAGRAAAAIEPILFAAERPPGGLRFVVQGGSSAAGFPYGRFAGLAGMLGDRLEAALPDREIEVVTTAMAAINSHAVLDQVDEIVAIEPDAVLIYAGHNEYLGVLGVGSALTGERSRAFTSAHLALTRLRVYTLLEGGIGALRAAFAPAQAPHGTLFARAAHGARIPIDSGRFRAGVRQLEANLGEALRRYAEAGVPVYVGTLVANERDLPPFVSGNAPGVDPAAWERSFEAWRGHRREGRTEAERASLDALLALDAQHADAWFALGRLEEREGDPAAARRAYRRAKDCDQLRFRAPEAFEAVIREQAQRHGATVVEVREAFVAESPDGLLGDALLLEHVHPNARGYFLLADAYYQALAHDGRLGDVAGAPGRAEAFRDLPLTEIDHRLAAWAVRELKAGPPFVETPQGLPRPEPADEVERLALALLDGEIDWLHAMEALLQQHRRDGDPAAAARVARVVAQAYPLDWAPNHAAGALYLALDQPARARRYLRRARDAAPDDVGTLRDLLRADLRVADAAAVQRSLAELRRVAPGDPLVRRLTPRIHARGPATGPATR